MERIHMSKRLNEIIQATGLGLLAVLFAVPVNRATAQSFPDHPLLSGRSGVAPNILFILDDSGSMRSLSMGLKNSDGSDRTHYATDDDKYNDSGLADSPLERSYVNNTIYYNPARLYEPWSTASGGRLGDADIETLSPSVVGLAYEGVTSRSKRSLFDHPDGVFYVPKPGVTNPGTTAANYDRYWISRGGVVVTHGSTSQAITGFPKTGLNSSMDPYTQRTFAVQVQSGTSSLSVATTGGGKDVKLNLVDPGGDTVCSSSSGNNAESCSVSSPIAGTWYIQVYRDGGTFSNVTLSANWIAPQPRTPTGRTQAAELQNIANWYQYHRTRMKVAKAGASEAFSQLGETYRVGLDTIWNRAPGTLTNGSTSGNTPSMIIPVGTDKGLFKGSNRSSWFYNLQAANANSGTPLHGALSRAGKYYSGYEAGNANDPWGTGNTSEKPLACRAAYAILTTDGFWNNSSGYEDVGDVDGDKVSSTLADVAMKYYKNDLRADIADNVPADRANRRHQRMTTFSVSIGLGGTLAGPPNAPPTVWPNPWTKLDGTTSAWSSESAKRIDDLWHAAVNTEGSFVVAANTDDFATALQSAFKSIDGRQASGSNLASNGPQVTAGSYKYSAIYHSSEWWGDLRAFPRDVSADGYSETPTWKLSDVVNADTGFSTRTVLTSSGGRGNSFETVYKDRTTFARTGSTTAQREASNNDTLRWLLGVRAKEDGIAYRKRKLSPIGDIVNSSPVYVNDNAYLFVGANDGMLHAINSANGKVAFSYVPAGLDFNALRDLSAPDYVHKFFVDGQIGFSKKTKDNSKNYLVAALGRGGKGVFALDVTDPAGMTKNDVLWDVSFQSGGHSDMGYVLGNPLVRMDRNKKMIALVPNGIDSASGAAALFVYNMDTGAATALRAGSDVSGNGLMVIEAVDLEANKPSDPGYGKLDLVYGGDLKGNLWRWDFRSSDAPVARLIFKAVGPTGKTQAITGGLTVAREGATGNIFVAFGTGRLISENDLPWVNAQGKETQSFYGIIDNLNSDGTERIQDAGTGASRYAQLTRRTIPYTGKDSKGRDARSFEVFSPLANNSRGWYVDLGVPSPFADGERVVSAPIAAGRALWIDSIWPSQGDGCEAATGNGYMNALDIFTGTNPSTVMSGGGGTGTYTFIDVNANGRGDDRLADKSYPDGDNSGYITSVAHGATMGKPDISDKEVCTQLDDGRVVCVKRTPTSGSGGSPKRLMWRELVNNG